jgi:DMSO/TMAO reductase YedYZ molybdopterin-dependent catalytic subunit
LLQIFHWTVTFLQSWKRYIIGMNHDPDRQLPPGQQVVAPGKWPIIGERSPAAVPDQWTLEIGGATAQSFLLTLEELRQFPQIRQTIDIHCVTRWSKLGVEFEGVLLGTLLDRAGLPPTARFVSFVSHSNRDHSTSLELSTALQQSTLIALKADGLPLSLEHGGPIRNIVPGRYFYKSVKWLKRIEVLVEDRLGFWEAESGYHNEADPWLEQRYWIPNLDRREAARLIASRDFSQQDLLSLSASNRDLSGLNARGAKLRNADFSRSDLRSSDFTEANLSNANLQLADLRGARFIDADLEGANFSGARLQGARFVRCSLIGSSFFDPEQGIDSGAIFDAETDISDELIAPLFPQQFEFVQQQLLAVKPK